MCKLSWTTERRTLQRTVAYTISRGAQSRTRKTQEHNCTVHVSTGEHFFPPSYTIRPKLLSWNSDLRASLVQYRLQFNCVRNKNNLPNPKKREKLHSQSNSNYVMREILFAPAHCIPAQRFGTHDICAPSSFQPHSEESNEQLSYHSVP